MTPIETPCIKICVMDSGGRNCTGCGRTLEEIARWGSMSAMERRAIMAVLPNRTNKLHKAAADA